MRERKRERERAGERAREREQVRGARERERELQREKARERKQERESKRESKRERVRRQQLDPDWRRQVNRAIYRTRRKRKRFMRFQAVKDACASGRAPPVQSKGGHVKWGRLFGNVSPAEALSFQ